VKRGAAAAKINLALVVGPRREDGKHELVTVYQRIALTDAVEVRTAPRTEVTGFPADTLVARALDAVRRPRDLAALPPNDLAESALADQLRQLGAFRADVSGAGPAVYGLFVHHEEAERARKAVTGHGRTWLTAPAWYV